MDRRRGLTWVELLVVVMVIGLLVVVLLPSRNGSGPARRAQCASNLSGIGKSLNIYAALYRDEIPYSGEEGKDLRWLSDQTPAFRALMMNLPPKAVPRDTNLPTVKVFYCPLNLALAKEGWEHGAASVWGYAMLNDRGAGAAGMPVLPERKVVPLVYVRKLTDLAMPADQELGMDLIVSDGVDVGRAKFEGVRGGVLPEMEYSTNHMDRGRAWGANVLCGDGHVISRAMSSDGKRDVAVRQGGGREAYIWVPAP